jgi:hypothetical protein
MRAMNKKIMSLALAISMLATAFAAISVASAATPVLTGSIVATNNLGIPTGTFFTTGPNHLVYFILTYSVDGLPTNAQFRIELVDGGGNVVATKTGVDTDNPADGQHNSSAGGGAGSFNVGAYGTDTMSLRAVLDGAYKIVATTTFKVMQNRVVIEPVRTSDIYAPGETIKIMIDAYHPDGPNSAVNVTISPVNVSWNVVSLVNYHWEVLWTIPDNATLGDQTIYVNRSDANTTVVQQFNDVFDIEYFVFEVSWDRDNSGNQAVYMPGENAVISFWAWSLPDFVPINITLDFNLTYDDGAGKVAWLNLSTTHSPFNVTIPAWLDTQGAFNVVYTAHAANNRNATDSRWIDMGVVRLHSIALDKAQYHPGDNAVVSVEVWAQDPNDADQCPLPGAVVTITMDDGDGNLVPVNATMITNSVGLAQVTLVLPVNMTEDHDYRVIGMASKLGFWDTKSVTLHYTSAMSVEVLVNKNAFISGESIAVQVIVLKNGVSMLPDGLMYGLVANGAAPDMIMTTNLNFSIIAPDVVDNAAYVWVSVQIGDKQIYAQSDNFAISMIGMTLDASKLEYYAGESIDFKVLVIGDVVGFTFRYTIVDNDLIPISSGALTLDTKGQATFKLDVPSTKNAESYTATVYGDNSNGVVLIKALTVNRATDYMVVLSIKTAPASTSGAYSPGQTITVGFEIIKQSSDLPDLAVVTARITDTTDGLVGEQLTVTVMNGELSITLPKDTSSGQHWLAVNVNGVDHMQSIMVDATGNSIWNSNVGGMMSMSDLILAILMIVVILMLLFMMMKRGGGAAVAPAEPKPAAPKEAKQDAYAPKSSVKCPSCGAMVEVATSKRPIEVMCPKCGTSQMVN